MSIPVLVQVNSLALGGTQIIAVDMAAAMRAHGFDSLLIGPLDSIPAEGESLLDVARERGVDLRPVERPTTTLQGARELSRIARRHRARLVHTYGTWSIRPAFWGPCVLGRRPLVMTVYEMHVHPSVYRAASLVIGTKYLEEELAHRRGPVRLISPPVDLHRDDPEAVDPSDFIAAHGLEAGHRRIVIVSRLEDDTGPASKSGGIEIAIRAVEALRAPDVDLVVVGAGNAEDRLRRRGEEANLRLGRDAIVFTGALADPGPAYACADVVIGMGASAARALAFGKPLVVNGELGWFGAFEPDRAEALFRNSFWWDGERPADPVELLVSELRPILDDPARAAALGAFGRRFARSNFSLEAMAQRLAEVYDDALASRRTRTWFADLAQEVAWARAWVGRRVGRAIPRPSEIDRAIGGPPGPPEEGAGHP